MWRCWGGCSVVSSARGPGNLTPPHPCTLTFPSVRCRRSQQLPRKTDPELKHFSAQHTEPRPDLHRRARSRDLAVPTVEPAESTRLQQDGQSTGRRAGMENTWQETLVREGENPLVTSHQGNLL